MNGEKFKLNEFVAQVVGGGRITIPKEIRELHGIKEGDILYIAFRIIKRREDDG